MKKRFLAAVLALAMATACMTACGGENNTEGKQQTTTTTTEETTTTATTSEKTTTTTSMPNGKAEYKITTIKATTTRSKMDAPPDIPQDVNPGQWHEDSETTTTTTTKAKTTTTKAKTTTTKATTTKAKVSTTNGYWHEDPGITKADLKAAAEAAFAKVKKTAKEYGWTITKTLVNRSTDTQYGIYFMVDIAIGADGESHGAVNTIKAETNGKTIVIQTCDLEYGRNGQTDTNYDHFCYPGPLEDILVFLKENGVKEKQ